MYVMIHIKGSNGPLLYDSENCLNIYKRKFRRKLNMKKINKLLAAALTVAMAVPMFAMSVSAAGTETGTTNVSYDNTHGVPDPDNPTNPNWAVTIPSTIHFTDTNTVVNVGVELVSINGGALPTTDVAVSVTSRNGYKLQMSGANPDAVPYVVAYGGVNMSTTVTEVGNVNSTNTTISGTATLQGTAAITGVHTDVLTYTITN